MAECEGKFDDLSFGSQQKEPYGPWFDSSVEQVKVARIWENDIIKLKGEFETLKAESRQVAFDADATSCN